MWILKLLVKGVFMSFWILYLSYQVTQHQYPRVTKAKESLAGRMELNGSGSGKLVQSEHFYNRELLLSRLEQK